MDDVTSEITALVEATWTDLTVIFRGQTAARINWRRLIDDQDDGGSGMAAPWAVVEWGPLMPAGFGCKNDSYEWTVSLYYVMRVTDGGGATRMSETDIEATLKARAESMRAALRGDGVAWQTLEYIMDFSSQMEANAFFLKRNMPFMAVAVRTKLICGAT
ncbi:MAG: hypothetical protein E6R03_00215 [Hyphomicrobiaceae bacterium]|nr:MAG: hypothetical protein E6R03_00215 [Hyphomicrobiaceae bacterium]